MTTINTAYAVFRDASRHTCIRVSVDRKYTAFIPFSASELTVKRLSHAEFDQKFTEIPDYPPERAAKLYCFADGVSVQATGEARTHLARLAGEPFVRPDLSSDPAPDIPPSTQKERIMASANTAPATEAPTKRKPAAKKAEAPAPAKKAAAPAKKAAAPAKKAPAPAAAEGGRGRSPNFSGSSKIKVLAKENPKRAAAAERFALYKNGMTVDEYLAAGGKRADVNWDVKMGFIEVK